jgi:hypothetical protein
MGIGNLTFPFISWSEVLRSRKCAPEACTGPTRLAGPRSTDACLIASDEHPPQPEPQPPERAACGAQRLCSGDTCLGPPWYGRCAGLRHRACHALLAGSERRGRRLAGAVRRGMAAAARSRTWRHLRVVRADRQRWGTGRPERHPRRRRLGGDRSDQGCRVARSCARNACGAAPGALACRQGRHFAQELALLENLLRQAADRPRAAAGPFLHVAYRRAVGDRRLRTRAGRCGCRDIDRDNRRQVACLVLLGGRAPGPARLPEGERLRIFTELWTLKEAYSKLTGTGLATDFRSVAFQVETGRQVAGRHTEHRLGDARLISWHAEAAGGLAHVSVAVDASDPMEDGGELVCCTAPGPATRGSA